MERGKEKIEKTTKDDSKGAILRSKNGKLEKWASCLESETGEWALILNCSIDQKPGFM